MPSTRWNKDIVPVNSDAYALTSDLAKLADKANVIVPVASAAERDGLTPPDGKYAGMAVTRTDVPGQPLEVYDGTNWDRHIAPVVKANTQTVGSGMATDTFLTGAQQPWFQVGTFVGTTTANGDLTITYPTPFPNGVVGGIGFSGDGVYIVSATPTNVAAPTTTSLFLRFAHPNGSVVVSTQVRGTWIAAGW